MKYLQANKDKHMYMIYYTRFMTDIKLDYIEQELRKRLKNKFHGIFFDNTIVDITLGASYPTCLKY